MAAGDEGKRSTDDNRLDLNQLAIQVIALLEPELSANGFELVDVRVFRGGGRHQLRIYVDAPEGGISIDQVTAASRTAGMLLEEADLITGQYVIEVSSPGIRRPLRTRDHFSAVVGEKVDLKVAMKDRRRARGVLRSVEEGEGGTTLVVEIPAASAEEEAETVRVGLGSVLEGNLDPDFDVQALINADRRKKRDDRRQERRAKKRPKKARPKAHKTQKAPKETGSE